MAQFTGTVGATPHDVIVPEGAAREAAQRQLAARLERLPMTATHRKARVVVGFATFFDGFDALAIAFVMPVIAGLWHLTPQQTGLLISGAYVGQILGALFFPWVAEQFGRLRSTAYSASVFGLASLGCAFAFNLPSLLVARFVQGCGLGGEVPVASAYINEIARAPSRGRFFLMYEASFAVGYLGAASVGVFLIPTLGWQSIFVIGALPAIIAAVMRRLLPESPRWLAGKGRVGEAEAIVAGMESQAAAKLGHALPAPDASRVPPPPAQRTRLGELFVGPYLRRTLVVWSLWFCNFFATQSLNTWLPTLYRTQFHLSVQQSLRLAFIGHFFSIGSVIVVALLLDRIGRRSWFAGAMALGGIILVVLAATGTADPILVMVLATAAVICLSTCSVSLYVYTPELYPTRMRALGCGGGATVRNIAGSLGPTLVGVVLAGYGVSSVFLMLGVVPIVAGVIVALFGIETKGRVLEEISP
jgi:MFS transporter, putative metabolite:H+ symporter